MRTRITPWKPVICFFFTQIYIAASYSEHQHNIIAPWLFDVLPIVTWYYKIEYLIYRLTLTNDARSLLRTRLVCTLFALRIHFAKGQFITCSLWRSPHFCSAQCAHALCVAYTLDAAGTQARDKLPFRKMNVKRGLYMQTRRERHV